MYSATTGVTIQAAYIKLMNKFERKSRKKESTVLESQMINIKLHSLHID